MNNRPPSGVPTPTDTAPGSPYAAYDANYDASYEQSYGQGVQYGYLTDAGCSAEDPLFGPLPGAQDHHGQPVGHDTGGYDTGVMWPADTHHPNASVPAQAGNGWESDPSGQWDTTSYDTGSHTAVTTAVTTVGYDTGGYDTGGYDTGGYHTGGYSYGAAAETSEPAGAAGAAHTADSGGWDSEDYQTVSRTRDPGSGARVRGESPDTPPEQAGPEPEPLPTAAAPRGRRRAAKPKRSALLSVAVPSACVMGVAGVAAASVSGVGEGSEDKSTQAADDAGEVEPSAANSKLDTQLAGLSADAGDFADRASRTQERIDLKERQEAERKRKEADAARKEAMRPKFALPVAQQGLSAYYGQAGVNWLSVHTGIDFPVSHGTPVMAATDGTVTTKWDLSYGNMAIVTAADGTETWYCHLSSTKIRSGQVKAGDTIAYSGNSGNSTGPHLHFEVRPGGGSAVDPLAWFRTQGLDPT